MYKRTATIVSTILTVVLIAGVASAVVGPLGTSASSTSTSEATSTTMPETSTTMPETSTTMPGTSTTMPGTSTTMPGTSTTMPGTSTTMPGTSTTIPAGEEVVFAAGDAGTVTIGSDGTSLMVVAVAPAAGWNFEIETPMGREVEVDFRDGTRKIKFDAELENGEIRVRVREETDDRDDDGDDTTAPSQDGIQVIAAGPAGTVTVEIAGNVLTVVSIDVADGWTYDVRTEGDEVKVEFRNADGTEIEVEAELEHGLLEVKVETKTDDSIGDDDHRSGDDDRSDDRGGDDDRSGDDDHGGDDD